MLPCKPKTEVTFWLRSCKHLLMSSNFFTTVEASESDSIAMAVTFSPNDAT